MTRDEIIDLAHQLDVLDTLSTARTRVTAGILLDLITAFVIEWTDRRET